MKAVIRIGQRHDLDAIDTIEASSFTADRFSRRNLRRMLMGGQTLFLIAQSGGDALGYLALSFRKGAQTARIYSLAVHPLARGQGLSRQLIDAAVCLAKSRGLKSLRLEVRQSNTRALKIYRDAGFRLRDRYEDYYEDGETAERLECLLDGLKKDTPL